MIAVDGGVALAIAAAVVMAVTAWAAHLSVRSAAAGPGWALAHLLRVRTALLAVPVAGVVAFLLVEPRWLGLVVGYVGAVGGVLAWMLARNLQRLRGATGFGEVPMERRREIVGMARRRMVVAGTVLVITGGILSLAGTAGPGLVMAGMGGSLAVTAGLIGTPEG